jgi:beta-galactosidase
LVEPQRTPRWRESFNSGWLFRRQTHGGGELGSFDRDTTTGATIEPAFRDAYKPEYDDSRWETIDLPHTWNAYDGCDEIPGYFRGIGWYRKHFQLAEELRGKRVFLEFEGVNQVSEFWLNGRRVGKHKGGYTTFEFDVTDIVAFGPKGNVLTVKVDNLYNPNISPTVKTDVTFYGGIYRDVWLRLCEPIFVSTVFWTTPRVSEQSAEVTVHSTVTNTTNQPRGLLLIQEIFDPADKLVGTTAASVAISASESREVVQPIEPLADPQLWSPDTPNLYRIRTSLDEAEQLIDSVEIPLGLRWFRFDAQRGFFLNGKRLQLQGTTWHQSYPGLGNALPNSRHVKDMEMIREMAVNFFLTSHYPHDPAVMDACDRLGMLVLEELFIGEEVEDTPEYLVIQTKAAEEMILRDRNHPCVILWGFCGEIDSSDQVAARVVTTIVKKYRELDPTRLTTMHDPRVETIKAIVDVVGLYSTWEDDDRDHQLHPERKYMIEEYTVAGIGRGIYGMGPDSEDLGCVKHEEFLSQVNLRPWIAGSVLWHQFDYDGEEYDPVIPHVVTFGMADSWRIPKDVFYFYQSQWSDKPMLHIVGHWTWPGDEGKAKSVKVYCNAPEVELFLNGKSLGIQRKGEYAGLRHPPRVWEVAYQPGTLKAVAHFVGKSVTDERKTAGQPARIVLESDVPQVNSGDRESLAYITAKVVDREGTVVPGAFNTIAFNSYGPGKLLPQTWPGHGTGFTWEAVAGMTRIAFRATSRVGRAVISAYCPGLALGRVEVQVAAKGKGDEMTYFRGAKIY